MRRTGAEMAVLALGLLLAACQGPTTPTLPLEELLAAPLTVDIDGRTFELETFLYRDFMPGVGPGGSLLYAVVELTAVDGEPFPDAIDADRLWVIDGDRIWETSFSGEARPRNPSRLDQLEKSARGGPRWDVGTEVEVVIRVTRPQGASRLLRATRQRIGMTV